MSPDLAKLHPQARPWFTDHDLLLRAVHGRPLSTTPTDVSALHQALTRSDAEVPRAPWVAEPRFHPYTVQVRQVHQGDQGTSPIFDGDHLPMGRERHTGEWVAAVRTEAPALLAAVRAALEPHWPVQVAFAYPNTHYPIPGAPPRWMCAGCLEESIEDCEPGWPCTTVSTLLRTLSEHL